MKPPERSRRGRRGEQNAMPKSFPAAVRIACAREFPALRIEEINRIHAGGSQSGPSGEARPERRWRQEARQCRRIVSPLRLPHALSRYSKSSWRRPGKSPPGEIAIAEVQAGHAGTAKQPSPAASQKTVSFAVLLPSRMGAARERLARSWRRTRRRTFWRIRRSSARPDGRSQVFIASLPCRRRQASTPAPESVTSASLTPRRLQASERFSAPDPRPRAALPPRQTRQRFPSAGAIRRPLHPPMTRSSTPRSPVPDNVGVERRRAGLFKQHIRGHQLRGSGQIDRHSFV